MTEEQEQLPESNGDYRDFAVSTAKAIAYEEGDKLQTEMDDDLRQLMDVWANRLSERIQNRMEGLGIPQVLSISIEWTPDYPKFHITGNTYVGGPSDSSE